MSNAAHQILVQRRNDWAIERRQALIVAPFVYGTLADIRQVMVRAMKRLNFDSDRRVWLRPITRHETPSLRVLHSRGYRWIDA